MYKILFVIVSFATLSCNSQDLSRPFYLTLYPVPAPDLFAKSLTKDLFISDFASLFIQYFMN